MRVVDDADQWFVGSAIGDQAEYGEADQEAIRWRTGPEPEGGAERVSLWGRNVIEPVQEWCTQLVQTGKGKFGLGLYARYQDDPVAFRAGYDDLLSSTGLGDAAELAARFGIDITRRQFWDDSLQVIVDRIDDYCRLTP